MLLAKQQKLRGLAVIKTDLYSIQVWQLYSCLISFKIIWIFFQHQCLSFIPEREYFVKAKLTRFTWALTMLAAMALSVGAGMRWDW